MSRYDPEKFPKLPVRRRLLVIGLAVATAVAVVLTLLYPPGGVKRTRAPVADCRAGQDIGCVGGRVDVLLPEAVAPASAGSATR